LAAGLRGATPLSQDSELARLERFAQGLVPAPGDATTSDQATPVQPGTTGGGLPGKEFCLHELLGEPIYGGMGLVWRARHKVLNQVRALKLLPAGSAADPGAVARFCQEAEATARLVHANIIVIHEFGHHDGQLYYTMDWLEGGTLADRLKAGPLAADDAADRVARLARAVQHAHDNKVIHRDLKPSNVLFTADGTPKLTDFGLAKMLDDEGLARTQTHAAMGTPEYMSPEQAAGHSRDATPAMDVWGLGAVLYHCLTGRAPFKGRSKKETLELVQQANPVLPSRLRKGLHPDLEAVCLKCLEKDPARRFPSAADLAADLERRLEKKRTVTPPLGRVEKLRRVARGHPIRAALVGLALTLAVLGPAVGYLLHPDRPLWELERRLARGEAVTLIGATGMPAWSQWLVGKGQGFAYADPDGTFTVSSDQESFLELVRDPGRTSYRFRADVRHRRGEKAAMVGVYLLRGQGRVPAGMAHWCYRVRFNNTTSIAPPRQPNAPTGNPVAVEPWLYVQGNKGRFCSSTGRNYSRTAIEPKASQWRKLAVEVTPARVVVLWEGERIAQVPAERMPADASDLEPNLQTGTRPEDWHRLPRVGFDARGSLGLFVMAGIASFREVVVEPLGAGP
jgi:serine/threonine-protein kinase